MYYVIITRSQLKNDIFDDFKQAKEYLKRSDGRMKTFQDYHEALDFLHNQPGEYMSSLLEYLSLSEKKSSENSATKGDEEQFPAAKPALLSELRKHIESGDYEKVEEAIWENPRCLVTVSDSATYLMAGPKYNACHIASRANKPEIMGLILDTISNMKFLKKLYPTQSDEIVQDRINHLLDSYLNTPDPRQGNTPLHFACKKGYYQVVKVLLTFEGCDLKVKDSSGQTAEESICEQAEDATDITRQKIKDLFRIQPHSPLHRDQLKKRLLLTKRLSPSKSTDT